MFPFLFHSCLVVPSLAAPVISPSKCVHMSKFKIKFDMMHQCWDDGMVSKLLLLLYAFISSSVTLQYFGRVNLHIIRQHVFMLPSHEYSLGVWYPGCTVPWNGMYGISFSGHDNGNRN